MKQTLSCSLLQERARDLAAQAGTGINLALDGEDG